MKIIKYLLTLIVASFLFIGCDQGFEDVNANVDDPVIIPSSMMIGTIARDVQNQLYSTFNGGEIGMTWAQHESLIQYNDPERYKPRETSMDGLWSSLYLAASNANQMYVLAETEGNEVNQGVALVLKAFCFNVLTDLYGDIPYSEALLGPSEGLFAPVYDSQSDVYAGILATLDDAIAKLSSGNGSINGEIDIVYGGDVNGWTKFAGSLKFRALMRISAKQDVSADLQALVDGGLLFTSNAEEAKLIYTSASPEANPMYETIVSQSRGEHKSAKTFIDALLDTNDPRISAYAQPAAGSGEYVGKPSGFAESPLPGYGYDDVSAFGALFLEPEAPAYFVSYTELLFLKAEAALKGYISGSAQEYYEAGIKNSFAELGVEGVDGYLSQSGIAYTSGSALQQICYQKWVTLFAQGFEAWTEWRRTKLPVLEPAADGYINEIPSRLKYNSDEVSINTVNYEAAVAAQGPDELTTPIWWME